MILWQSSKDGRSAECSGSGDVTDGHDVSSLTLSKHSLVLGIKDFPLMSWNNVTRTRMDLYTRKIKGAGGGGGGGGPP